MLVAGIAVGQLNEAMVGEAAGHGQSRLAPAGNSFDPQRGPGSVGEGAIDAAVALGHEQALVV